MIGIGIAKLIMGERADPSPPLARISEFPFLFAVSTYVFKCQHCLPGVFTPMKTKRGLFVTLFITFIIILAVHLLLSYTASLWLSSDELNVLYTLNFFTTFKSSDDIGSRILAVLGYYIALYPAFACSANFTIGSITLRENMKELAQLLLKKQWLEKKVFRSLMDLFFIPTAIILVPLAISFATANIELLVILTGGFLGIWLQYLISASLAFAGKRMIVKKLKVKYDNKYKSPFSNIFFLVFIVLWTVVTLLFVIVSEISKYLW